jgi:hypothetical protein
MVVSDADKGDGEREHTNIQLFLAKTMVFSNIFKIFSFFLKKNLENAKKFRIFVV